jgi:NSS family neurotransmitter:Na+ symporter
VVAGWAFGYFIELVFGTLLAEQDYGSFFGNYVNDINSNLIYSFGFLFLTAFTVVNGVQKGIEKANKILMPALFLVLLILIGYSLTLPEAAEGIRFYLVPDFSEITAQTIFDALRLSFFTLSLGVGGLITYGSYVRKDENIIYASSVVTWADTIIAFLAGLMVFPLVFSAGLSPAEGPALVFMVMPEIFKGMGPLAGKLIGGAFFLLLCFAALPSCISLLELPVAYFVDEKKYPRKYVVWILCLVIFLLGLPSMMSFGVVPALNKLAFYKDRDFLTLVADMTDITLTIGGCLMCVFISRKWKLQNFDLEIQRGASGYAKSFVRYYLHISIRYICPVLLGVLSVLVIVDKFFGLFD